MSIRVSNIYTGSSETYSGTPEQIRSKLYLDWPELAKFGPISIDSLVAALNRKDCFVATTELLKTDFWIGQDLVKYIGFYGDPKDESEVPAMGTPVEGMLPEDNEIAEIIQKDIDLGRVKSIDLGGKHSHGSLVASSDSGTWLLKASSNGQSPAEGLDEQSAPPTRREGAYYRCAQAMGISEVMPTHVINIGGVEYAAMHLLDREWRPAKEIYRLDHGGLTRILNMRLLDCFKWGFMDFVLVDPDRHGGNIMMKGTEIVLLDHGASFAGDNFGPKDKNTFVPFYLRAQIQNFESKTPEERIQTTPRLSRLENESLQKWISGINPQTIKGVMTRFGITPDAVLRRLQSLVMTAGFMAPDLAIADAWLQR